MITATDFERSIREIKNIRAGQAYRGHPGILRATLDRIGADRLQDATDRLDELEAAAVELYKQGVIPFCPQL